ncbi:MAG: hypothetical protein LBK47_02800 [Prevotellaceae bacterium]|nr:hypothetical protein [Prevotellaceae bacterium]
MQTGTQVPPRALAPLVRLVGMTASLLDYYPRSIEDGKKIKWIDGL